MNTIYYLRILKNGREVESCSVTRRELVLLYKYHRDELTIEATTEDGHPVEYRLGQIRLTGCQTPQEAGFPFCD